MNNKKAFIFDLDGVIVDTAKYHFLAWQKIAKELNISYSTVENHKRNLRRKTNTKTSVELVHFMMNNNLL